ncbi:PREDICTED: zinc finger CCCH-type antiviral protein 1-like [Nanorana parkeri]|uniref:zinc finger CCCH-type antiviral protein 1-like n=1 Tax=Nanorana parkeri TaxID=125878 RepID=UPI000854F63D|nr:PREDICTED: zinc finger CCCH-type antiviral protein 1-like [Nanorana parkeri]
MGASSSSSSIIASVGTDTSSVKLQASVKPIIQTETKSKAQYSLTDEAYEFLGLPPKATSSTTTQPQPANSVSSISPEKSSQQQTTEICHANLWKYCDLGGKCTKMHYYLPYRWQLFSGIDWDDLPNMEDIERTYCDPKMDRYQLIDFQAMKSGFKSVRRLATPSSVTQPSECVLSTEWRWYWKNEYGIWTEYGKLSRENMNATILSSDLESIYLSDPTGTIPFFAENQSYYIDCQEMKQRNSYFMTEREVRRRPKFLDFQNVKMLRGR